MFVDCIFCIAMNKPGDGARSGEVPAMILTHRETGEKFALCKACAEMWEQALARFGAGPDFGKALEPIQAEIDRLNDIRVSNSTLTAPQIRFKADEI